MASEISSNHLKVRKSVDLLVPFGTSQRPFFGVFADISSGSSRKASIRKMKALLTPPPRIQSKSPTDRFILAHPMDQINSVLLKQGASSEDLRLFDEISKGETEGFLGYQAGSSTVRLFQDLIFMVVKHVLNIPIKDDFVFTRVPGDPVFQYEAASDFLNQEASKFLASGFDTYPSIRRHVLSMNMNLYQSYDAPWDLTPRYYLENTTFTNANVNLTIKPFFRSLGISDALVDRLWFNGLGLLPHHRGYILQFFDESRDYEFAKQHSYVAYSGGKPNPNYSKHDILFDETASNFPQLRLVLANQSTLNPFSDLSVKRYDCMTDIQRQKYESSLCSLIKELPFDSRKILQMREDLLKLWI